jgi:hypothetical protein
MFDQLCYENAVRQLTEMCMATNATERDNWDHRKAAFLQDIVINRALKIAPPPVPNPPAMMLWVNAPPWAEGVTQAAIQVHIGPARVADANIEVPPIPDPNLAGVTDIGGPLPENPGLFARGPLDTKPWGAVVTKDGKKYVRDGNPFGRGWYREL